MLSSSELQRVALSARNCLQIQCRIPLLNKSKSEILPSLKIAEIDVTNSIRFGEDHSLTAVEERDCEKNNLQNEINNSTIVSVEPETSFGDMTLDSIKDHLLYALVIKKNTPDCLLILKLKNLIDN